MPTHNRKPTAVALREAAVAAKDQQSKLLTAMVDGLITDLVADEFVSAPLSTVNGQTVVPLSAMIEELTKRGYAVLPPVPRGWDQ
jgi:hypothetical protein